MIILHIAYSDSFYLWAEQTPTAKQVVAHNAKNAGIEPTQAQVHNRNSQSALAKAKLPKGRNNRAASAVHYQQLSLIRDLDEEGWAKKIAPLFSSLDFFDSPSMAERQIRKRLSSHQIWLPSKDKQALASSPLVNEQRAKGAPLRPIPNQQLSHQDSAKADDIELLPWRVTTMRLSNLETINFLKACRTRTPLAATILAGPGITYLEYVLSFAERLFAKGSFLPGLVKKNSHFCARWQPIPDSSDEDHQRILSAYLPPVLCSLDSRPRSQAPYFTPTSTTRELCEEFLDTFVHQAINKHNKENNVGTYKIESYKTRRFEPPHQVWLKALLAEDPSINQELGSLPSELETWRASVDRRLASPIRIVFKLEEPLDASGMWTLRFLVQPKEDPSLMLKAEEVWAQNKNLRLKDAALVREHLTTDLWRAAQLNPTVAIALKSANPSSIELSTDDAYHFLTHSSFDLKEAGFIVQVPVWWSKGGLDRRISLKASVPNFNETINVNQSAGLSLNTLIKINWEMALGGDTLDLKELEELAKLKAPLIKIRGQWIELSAEDVQQAKDFWRHQQEAPNELALRDIVNLALGTEVNISGMESSGLVVSGVNLPEELNLTKKSKGKDASPIAELLLRLGGDASSMDLDLEVPEGLNTELRPYQRRGYAWLDFITQWGLGACLADDMGLGKTVQTLAVLLRQYPKNVGKPFLLVCPTSVIGNWKREIERFTPSLSYLVHHGPQRKKGKELSALAHQHAIFLTSYGLLARDIASLSKVQWAGIILDEAQQIKNPDTAVAKAARALKGDSRIALTGTPVENHVGDLWAIMDFLNPGILGSRSYFKQKYLLPIQNKKDSNVSEELRKLTSPFILRRIKTDKTIIADLPEKIEIEAWCNLSKEQASLYSAVLKDLEKGLESKEGIARKGLVLSSLTKLKQICDHPALFLADKSALKGRSGKLSMLENLCSEIIASNEAALIFTQFSRMGGLLQTYLQEALGREVLFLCGSTPMKLRDTMVERFQSADGPPIFVLSLKAGGTGLNLTRASHVIHYDRWWNPAVETQATDRAFRIGQDKNVQVRKLICAGTLEERVHELIESKRHMADNIVAVGENWITKLSGQDLSQVLALDLSSVEEDE